jgi:hypothetical protein
MQKARAQRASKEVTKAVNRVRRLRGKLMMFGQKNTNFAKNMHYNVINALKENGDVIILPWLRTKDMLCSKGPLALITKETCKLISHYKLMQRIIASFETTPGKVCHTATRARRSTHFFPSGSSSQASRERAARARAAACGTSGWAARPSSSATQRAVAAASTPRATRLARSATPLRPRWHGRRPPSTSTFPVPQRPARAFAYAHPPPARPSFPTGCSAGGRRRRSKSTIQ